MTKRIKEKIQCINATITHLQVSAFVEMVKQFW